MEKAKRNQFLCFENEIRQTYNFRIIYKTSNISIFKNIARFLIDMVLSLVVSFPLTLGNKTHIWQFCNRKPSV